MRPPFSSRRAALGAVALLTGCASIFMSASSANAVADPVLLGDAESFAVLAYSTITNTGPSIISGDIGLHPGSAITGFPPGSQPAGAAYVADAVALNARLDAGNAFTVASGQAGPVALSGVELGGLTLGPDLYQSPGVLQITGTLTLDAGGDSSAVFVFRSMSALDTASSSQVLLTGLANPCNVFWIVPSSATLETNSDFVGTIIATTSITAKTGTDVVGRLLALNGAVTLDSTTVTSSGCTAPVSITGAGTTVTAASAATASAAAAAAAASAAAAAASAAALANGGVEGEALIIAAGTALTLGGILLVATRRRTLRHR